MRRDLSTLLAMCRFQRCAITLTDLTFVFVPVDGRARDARRDADNVRSRYRGGRNQHLPTEGEYYVFSAIFPVQVLDGGRSRSPRSFARPFPKLARHSCLLCEPVAIQDNPEHKFRLGDGDGSCSNSKCKVQLFLDGSLDYTTRNTYKLVIVAVDGAGRTLRVNPTEFTLVVNVIDVQK